MSQNNNQEPQQPSKQDHSQINEPMTAQINKDKEEIYVEPIQIKPEEPQAERFVEEDQQKAQKLKGEGNEEFKSQSYMKAVGLYQQALRYASIEQTKFRCVLYSNISICLSKENDHKDSVQYCKKAIKNDPTYMKAYLNLAIGYEKLDNSEEALNTYKQIIQINPSDIKSQMKVKQLEIKVNEKNEKMKKQAIDGLKSIGNSFLGLFGMSLDNFKLNQGQNGGYNVSFKN